MVRDLACPEVTGSTPMESQKIYELALIGLIRGATWCPVIEPCVTYGFDRTKPMSAQSPCQSAFRVSFVCHASCPKPTTCHHIIFHPIIHTTMFQSVTRPRHHMDWHVSVRRVHVYNPYFANSTLEMPNPHGTCHLLVLPRQHSDIICHFMLK